MVVMKSKKILVLIIIALIVVLFANMMIIKSKKLSLSKIENEKEIVTEINNIDDEEKEDIEVIVAMKISKSSYFYQESAFKKPDKYTAVRKTLASIFNDNYQCYGYRRLYSEVRKQGLCLSEKVIRRLMKEEGLQVKCKRRRKYSSYKGEISPEVPNLIKRNFHADKPNEKWLTDITEFAIPAGKVYLSPIIDCFDGEPVSWTIGTSPSADLAKRMLDDAIKTLPEGEHPIVHSDRGFHYRCPRWIQRMN